MKNNVYKYCILKYKHSPFLGECINIGLLIYFSNDCKFSFRYSKNLSRVKHIYNNVPEKTIREYLKQINRRLRSINVSEDLFHRFDIEDLTDFISKHVLTKDSSVLQFTDCKSELQYEFTNSFIENLLIKKHFIEDIVNVTNYPKEPQLSQKFFSYINSNINLKNINQDKKRFYIDYTVVNETGNEFKFDYAWQNGTLNLVKPISFDLKESKSIADKAYKNLGQFIDLENEAKENNLRYDLIIGKPSSKSLFKEYDHAINLLEKIKHASLIEEDDLKQYSYKAIKAITEI